MNLANIDSGSVSLVGSVNDDATAATHTIAINTASGYLYRAGGGSNGLRVYNLNGNPASPARVGTYSAKYVHEAQIVNYTSGPAAGKEIAYICGGLGGGFTDTGLDVLDVTNKASIIPYGVSSHYTYPNRGYCHQSWLSPDRQFVYMNDELDEQNTGNPTSTHVWNASNPATLVYQGSFGTGNSATGHNLYTTTGRIFESNYRAGLRVFSTSNPGTQTAPVEIGYFDTYPSDDSNSFNGLWNNYP
jgi:choice-of-anchor B domain-containing protein